MSARVAVAGGTGLVGALVVDRRVRDARGSRRPVLAVRLPGAVGAAMATGELLPRDEGPRSTETFAEWLALSRGRVRPRSG